LSSKEPVSDAAGNLIAIVLFAVALLIVLAVAEATFVIMYDVAVKLDWIEGKQ
jgi:hypothetical protein